MIILYSNIGLEYERYEKVISVQSPTSGGRIGKLQKLWKCGAWSAKLDTFEEAKTACEQNPECRYIENEDCHNWEQSGGDGEGHWKICTGDWLIEDIKTCAFEKAGKEHF